MSREDANSQWCDELCRDFFLARDDFASRLPGVEDDHPNKVKCLKWKQEFDDLLQEHVSRVDAFQKEIQRHLKENLLGIEVYKHTTGMAGAPEYLQDEMRQLKSQCGDMQAVDHVALQEKATKMPMLELVTQDKVKKTATPGTKELTEEFADRFRVCEELHSSTLPAEEPVNEPGATEPSKAIHPCSEGCSQVLSTYGKFLQHVFALPEQHLKKSELCEWCARFGAKLVLHFGEVRNLRQKASDNEKATNASYVDAMSRQAFMSKEEQHATHAYFAELLTEATGIMDKLTALCGEATHQKFWEELSGMPKIEA